MSDLKKLTKAQLVALIERTSTTEPKARASKPARKAKGRKAKAFTPNKTTGFSIDRDPRSDEFGIEYGILRFLDDDDKPHTGALREDDTLGKELIEEIKSYAKANAVGRSRVRYNRALNAWTGRMDMLPARLRKLAGL